MISAYKLQGLTMNSLLHFLYIYYVKENRTRNK